MNRIFSCGRGLYRGKVMLPVLLGLFTLSYSPVADSCGPGPTPLHCPVNGLGGDFDKGCGCPSGYCPRNVTLKSPSVEYKGGKVYFCCGGCIEQFKKTPAKFATLANHQLLATGQAKQEHCPLCGGDCKNGNMITVAGVKVRVCGEACSQKVAKAKTAEQLQMVFGDAAFGKAFVVKSTTAAPAPSGTATNGGSCEASTEAGCCCCGKESATRKRD